ncbi:MAG: nucleotide exchange factor GrpE [Pseudomonadota bacterium]
MSEANSSADEHERGDNPSDDNVEISETATEAAESAGEDALAAAEARANENWDKYLRAVAELDNVRKRATRDVENARKYGVERLVGELLAVSDSMEAALASGEATDAAALLEGNSATLKLLASVLTKFGVEQIDPAGEPFDPQRHEAMTMVPNPDVEPNTVIDVIQKGYALNGRLVRPARVVVASAPADA